MAASAAACFQASMASLPNLVSLRSSRRFLPPSSAPMPTASRDRLLVVSLANPSPPSTKPSNISQQLSDSIKQAEEVCAAENASGECAAAWDEVEELSAEIAHKRVQSSEDKDPLEKFCKESPEADECRVYED